jgi:hypothetical protein
MIVNRESPFPSSEEVQVSAFRVVPIPESVAEDVRRTKADPYGNESLEPIRVEDPKGYPCRLCLEDAQVGEEVLLFSYSPFERPAPYRNLGPIFVHAHACAPYAGDTVPELLRGRLLALRSYGTDDRMVDCDVVQGSEIESTLSRLFSNAKARYVHVHNARPGCFMARVDRAPS